MQSAAEPLVKVTVGGDGVALLELNRAQKRNALSRVLLDELIAAIELLEQNNAVRVVVFTGSPGGPFCGMNIRTCRLRSLLLLNIHVP